MAVQLQVGKRYRNGADEVVTIGAEVVDHPEWVWSIAGNWYEKASGRYLFLQRKLGTARPVEYPIYEFATRPSTWRNLTEEVQQQATQGESDGH